MTGHDLFQVLPYGASVPLYHSFAERSSHQHHASHQNAFNSMDPGPWKTKLRLSSLSLEALNTESFGALVFLRLENLAADLQDTPE
jgi:hypothetical protein